ncbi:GCN5-related N-acetyltransferase [Cellulomonas flavigena DSM 20109]|uniref:GCN5-related N-acetyltransferase n=1 Tax=Cellulomonas flavigena (strain ATCC 482 / DSM 20109 / BCRC 11376 / JCM 18109 / NBRC 3775 / NCIMB 8073 / NRS 134) TaxID=446466 RepID=D5UBJ6_CELFN|nr:GNAT family N-acetyltransferase [Cellulomonas flavigena]ADG74091.1 GCN5-related N-acetyltransferase [Cellulomonas flavigena DSM 20109]
MTLPPGYTLHATPPAPDDYLRLRRDAGLRPKTVAQAAAALAGSWSACHVTAPDGTTVAMGRVVGDGGWYFVVADMATSPAHQRRGLGTAVLDHLLADVAHRAPDDAYVSLTTESAGRALYEGAGFTTLRPDRTGMQLVLPARATP